MNNLSKDQLEKKQKQQAYEEAAQWYMLMQEQALSTSQQIEFETWLDQSEMHKNVWKNVTIFDEKFHRIPKQTITKTMQQIETKPSMIASKLSLAFISFFAALYAYQGIRQEDYLPDLLSFSSIDIYKTQIGEQQHLVLQDGSKVWLNSNSKLRVKYTEQRRHLELTKGEIYIETHKDLEQRQFTVETKHGELLALGTVFNVRYYPEYTSLSVQEGIVRVSPQNGTAQQDISALHAIIFDRSSISVQTYQTMQSLWRQQLLVVHSMPLKQFVNELNRYDSRQINLAQSIENTLISGSYSTKNIEKTLQMVANTHQFTLKITDRYELSR